MNLENFGSGPGFTSSSPEDCAKDRLIAVLNPRDGDRREAVEEDPHVHEGSGQKDQDASQVWYFQLENYQFTCEARRQPLAPHI